MFLKIIRHKLDIYKSELVELEQGSQNIIDFCASGLVSYNGDIDIDTVKLKKIMSKMKVVSFMLEKLKKEIKFL